MLERVFYTINETIDVTRLSRTTVYKFIREGKLETKMIGNKRLVYATSLHALTQNPYTGGPRDAA